MVTIKESLTFDDVLLLPRYSDVLPSETDISLKLSNKIHLKVLCTLTLKSSIKNLVKVCYFAI